MDEDGPQAARSKRLAQTKREPVELPPPLQMPSRAAERSTVPVSTSTECPLTAPCRLELARLADDKAFLTQYVERLLNQLRTLLQKYGDLDQLKRYTDSHALEKAAAEDEDAQATLPAAPWLTSLEYTNPLFQAYDLKIHELVRRHTIVYAPSVTYAGLFACRNALWRRTRARSTTLRHGPRVWPRRTQGCASRTFVFGAHTLVSKRILTRGWCEESLKRRVRSWYCACSTSPSR